MTDARTKRPEKVSLAVSIMIASTFLMSFQDAIVKFVSADLPLWQIYVVRSLVAIPMLLVLVFLAKGSRAVMPRALGWAMLRGALLVAMYIAFYAALPVLDLSVVAAAYYTGPLFITLFSALMIGERVGPRRLVAIALGFIGVLVILRPGTEDFSAAMLVPIVSAVLYALAAILTRSKCVEETPIALSLALNVCFILCGLLGTAVLAAWQPAEAARYPFLLGPWVPLGVREGGIILLLAVATVGIHLGLAKAYQSAPPPVIATFDYSYLVFAAVWGYLLFTEVPDMATVAGMSMIAGAGLLIVLCDQRRSLKTSR